MDLIWLLMQFPLTVNIFGSQSIDLGRTKACKISLSTEINQ